MSNTKSMNEYERLLVEHKKAETAKNEPAPNSFDEEKEKEVIVKILEKEFSDNNCEYFLIKKL